MLTDSRPDYNNMVGIMGIKIRSDLFVYLEILLRFYNSYINGYILLKDALTVKYDRRKINAL